MINEISHPDSTMFSLATLYSSKTGTIATIKYGNICIESDETIVVLKFGVGIDNYLINYHVDLSNKFGVPTYLFVISYSQINKTSLIFDLITNLLNISYLNSNVKPTISIPFNYFKKFLKQKVFYLDSFFSICDQKNASYCIEKKRGFYNFHFLINGNIIQTLNSVLVLRSGKGNEDL